MVELAVVRESLTFLAATNLTLAGTMVLGWALLRSRVLIATHWGVQLLVLMMAILGVWNLIGVTVLGDSPGAVIAADLAAVTALALGLAIGWWRERSGR